MFKGLLDWYLAKLTIGGYPLIALLMAIESSVVPLPSELIIPPAAHLAYTHQARLGIVGIVLAGTLGSWIGATLMYWAARLAGRPLLLNYGRYVLITPNKIQGAERWAGHYGSMGVFVSRLLPVVRHLIGIPAGIVRMDYRLYSLYTLAGSAVWCGVLCYVGIKMGQDQELMKGQAHRVSIWLGGAVFVLATMYYLFVHRQMKAANAPQQREP